MRRLWLAAMVAGCTTEAPDVTGVDLLVSSTSVSAYVHYENALDNFPQVPDVDGCAALDSDEGVAVKSTLTGVALDGIPLSNGSPFPDLQVSAAFASAYGSGVTADTVFRATDVGITIAVPIHAGTYATATDLHAQAQGTDLAVTWSSPAADSVLVGTAGGFGLYSCRRPASSQFVVQNHADLIGSVVAQPLSAPEVTETELGTVRVFYGEAASIAYMP